MTNYANVILWDPFNIQLSPGSPTLNQNKVVFGHLLYSHHINVLYSYKNNKKTFIFPNSTPGGSEVKAAACNAGDLVSIPGSGRSPGEKERLPSPVFWPEKFHGLYSPQGRKELDTTARLSLSPTPLLCTTTHTQDGAVLLSPGGHSSTEVTRSCSGLRERQVQVCHTLCVSQQVTQSL